MKFSRCLPVLLCGWTALRSFIPLTVWYKCHGIATMSCSITSTWSTDVWSAIHQTVQPAWHSTPEPAHCLPVNWLCGRWHRERAESTAVTWLWLAVMSSPTGPSLSLSVSLSLIHSFIHYYRQCSAQNDTKLQTDVISSYQEQVVYQYPAWQSVALVRQTPTNICLKTLIIIATGRHLNDIIKLADPESPQFRTRFWSNIYNINRVTANMAVKKVTSVCVWRLCMCVSRTV